MTDYEAMQEAIDYAWATTDPAVKRLQIELIGDTHVPTPEEFIEIVSRKILTFKTICLIMSRQG